MKDRLPDLLHDRLPAELRAEVHAHLNTCADCRAELALLQRVRAAAIAPRMDSSRIVSALPAYRAVSGTREATGWRRMWASPMLRVAAAIALLAGGVMLVLDRPGRIDEPPVTPPVATVPPAQAHPADTTRTVPQRRPVSQPPVTELAMAEMFDDLTDAELKALLDALGTLEAVTPVETEVVVPAVNREGT